MIIALSTIETFLKSRLSHHVVFSGVPEDLAQQIEWCENRCRGHATNLKRLRYADTQNRQIAPVRHIDYHLEDTWDIWADKEHHEVQFLFKNEGDAALFKLFWRRDEVA